VLTQKRSEFIGRYLLILGALLLFPVVIYWLYGARIDSDLERYNFTKEKAYRNYIEGNTIGEYVNSNQPKAELAIKTSLSLSEEISKNIYLAGKLSVVSDLFKQQIRIDEIRNVSRYDPELLDVFHEYDTWGPFFEGNEKLETIKPDMDMSYNLAEAFGHIPRGEQTDFLYQEQFIEIVPVNDKSTGLENSSSLYEITDNLEVADDWKYTSINPRNKFPSQLGILENNDPVLRMVIPAVDIDSVVTQLSQVDTKDGKAWQNPKNVVGHIQSSSSIDLPSKGWYFGHLESPILGNGNVFNKLPLFADLIREKGDESFHIFLETNNHKFIYNAYRTEMVHKDDLEVFDLGQNEITLVTCYPHFIYDHRLLVRAYLVGIFEY